MSTSININGAITAPEDAKISILDHGLLFGDSVYEVLRTYQGKPFLFSRHFARLEHSASGIDLQLPWNKSETLEQINRTLIPGECRIRLVVTRGVGELSPSTETCADPTPIIIVAPLVVPPENAYTDGVNVVISSVRRSGRHADIKTGSLIHQVLALREARSKGAFEAILLTGDNQLSDGITSNIYLVREGVITTPPHDAGIVEGITRGVVLDLARKMGIRVTEGLSHVTQTKRADEMFLTSTGREVLPITRVDGKPVGNGRRGPITTRLLEAYRAVVPSLLEED
ncbi:MAG TPA: aminotransferase class IV [Terriglobia bacterium]|nr:aminotransferase class IV [Terriglobia bacterium]